MSLEHRIAVARGDRPADLVVSGGTVVNLATRELIRESVAIADGYVVGLGDYDAIETRDATDLYVAPSFIESHLHIESTLLTPPALAGVLAAHGTGAMVTDLHEIANVLGKPGVRYMLDAARDQAIDFLVTIASSVPASPLGTSGAVLDVEDLAELDSASQAILGLGEVMAYPHVIAGEKGVLDKLKHFAGRPIDGHFPGGSGRELNAYLTAGPRSDHETSSVEEGLEKLRRGMWLMLREAAAAKNLDDLLPLITPDTAHRLMLCSDDRPVDEILEHGHIDFYLRRIVAAGVDPMIALQMATLNPATYFGLPDRGLVVPGHRADLVLLEDLESFRPNAVFHAGRAVAYDGAVLPHAIRPFDREPPSSGVRFDLNRLDLSVPVGGTLMRVISARPDRLTTSELLVEPTVLEGFARADPDRGIAKLAAVERHGKGGTWSVGFVEGLGLLRGALASTVGHDCHNLMIAGMNDDDMYLAARRAQETGGGLVVALGGAVLAELPLPVAGLMSNLPAHEVAGGHRAVLRAAAGLGARVGDPFMTLSFMALEVIPHLKLTDRGLVDVDRFEVTELFVR